MSRRSPLPACRPEYVLLEVPDYRRRLFCGCRQRCRSLVLVCIMVAETVATFTCMFQVGWRLLPRRAERRGSLQEPRFPRAMAFVFIVLIIMVIVSGPLSASWIG